METMEGNKLIAEFMGAEYERKRNPFTGSYNETYTFSGHPGNWRVEKTIRCQETTASLCYHTDWDWLMPVFYKIKEAGAAWSISDDETWIISNSKQISKYKASIHENSWQAVVEFIEWHNSEDEPPFSTANGNNVAW